jgi:hypothetical protein
MLQLSTIRPLKRILQSGSSVWCMRGITRNVKTRMPNEIIQGRPGLLEIIRRDTEVFIPGRTLGQTPRWLANDENRAGKEFSTIVLAFIGSEKLVDLGGKIIHSIRIANKWCNLKSYIPFGTTTQCTNCQGFGHPKAFCKAEQICAVCAGKHMTQKHECPT